MMTEEEARGRWCPMTRLIPCDAEGNTSTIYPTAYNRGTGEKGTTGVIPNSSVCIGSRCMMWRWLEAEPKFERRPTEDLADLRKRIVGSRKGLCGLAGKVQY